MKMRIFLMLGLLLVLGCTGDAQEKPKAAETRSSAARERTDPVKVGEVAPDFTLKDENGQAVTLSAVKRPVVLVFYRGYW